LADKVVLFLNDLYKEYRYRKQKFSGLDFKDGGPEVDQNRHPDPDRIKNKLDKNPNRSASNSYYFYEQDTVR